MPGITLKAVGQLTKNPEADYSLVSDAYKALKKAYPENPFIPNLRKGSIVWAALVPVNAIFV